MTTKTEEQLAEAFKAGFIEACNWPEPVPQDADSPAAVLAFGAWRGNQAAHEAAKSERAQAEPLAWCEVHAGKLHGLGAKRNDAMGLRTPLYTQPPQQVSVPDGLLSRVQDLIPLLEDGRETHVEWRDWLKANPENEKVNPDAGDAEFHAAMVKEYDERLQVMKEVIDVLASARQKGE